MKDTFVCSICALTRYRHDVVTLPEFVSSEDEKKWKDAIGEENYKRAFKQENPVACVEHFDETQFDARGEAKFWKPPTPMPPDEREFVQNYFNDHGYSKLCKEDAEKIGGRISIEHVYCSVCSLETSRKDMVQHAIKHCQHILHGITSPCRVHQKIIQASQPKTGRVVGEVQAAYTRKVNNQIMANCANCIARHHRAQQEHVKQQATICFPLFTFRYVREAHEKGLQTQIIGIISANYMKTRFRLRGPLSRHPGEGVSDQREGKFSEEDIYKGQDEPMPEKLEKKPISYAKIVAQALNVEYKKNTYVLVSSEKKPAVATGAGPSTSEKKSAVTTGAGPSTSEKKPDVTTTAAPTTSEKKADPMKEVKQILKTALYSKPNALQNGCTVSNLTPLGKVKLQTMPIRMVPLVKTPPKNTQPESEKESTSDPEQVIRKPAGDAETSSTMPKATTPTPEKPRYQPYIPRGQQPKSFIKIGPRPIEMKNYKLSSEPLVLQACPQLTGKLFVPTAVNSEGKSTGSIKTVSRFFTTQQGLPNLQLVEAVKDEKDPGFQWPKTVKVVFSEEKKPESLINEPSTSIVTAQLMVEEKKPETMDTLEDVLNTSFDKSPQRRFGRPLMTAIIKNETELMNPILERILKNKNKPPKKEIYKSLLSQEMKNKPVTPKKKVKKSPKKKKIGKEGKKDGVKTVKKEKGTKTPKKKLQPVVVQDLGSDPEPEEHDPFADDYDFGDVDLEDRPVAQTNRLNDDDDEYSEIIWMSGPMRLRKMILQRFAHRMHPTVQEMLSLAEETKSKYRIIFDNYDRLRRHHHVKCDKGDSCDRIKEYFNQELYTAPTMIAREDIRDLLDGEFEKHLKTRVNFTIGHVHLFAEMTGLHPKTIRTRYSTVRQRFYDEARQKKQFVPKMFPCKKPLTDEEKHLIMLNEFRSDHFPNPQIYIELATHLNTNYEEVQRFYNTNRVRRINEMGMYDDVDVLNKKNSDAMWAAARKPRVYNYDERVKISLKLGLTYNTVCYWLDNYIVQLQTKSTLMK